MTELKFLFFYPPNKLSCISFRHSLKWGKQVTEGLLEEMIFKLRLES